jgi:ATP-dependent Lon protease
VLQQFDQYVKLNKKIPPEILTSIASIDDPGRLADTIAAHLPLKLDNKQVVLDLAEVKPAWRTCSSRSSARSRSSTSTSASAAA